MSGENSHSTHSEFAGSLLRWLPIRRGEFLMTLLAFGWFLLLMAGYYVLRPLRESLGAGLGRAEISRLFLYTFFVMVVIVPAWSHLVTRVPRRILIHVVFHFLAANILIFAFAQHLLSEDSKMLSRVYFVWVSVFGLFAVSVFWSVLTDIFSHEQSKRLFGPIASGATMGGLLGSMIANRLSEFLGATGLLLVVFLLLECGMLFASLLQRSAKKWKAQTLTTLVEQTGSSEINSEISNELSSGADNDTLEENDDSAEDETALDRALTGLREIGRSRYLMVICVYFVLISVCGTTIYMQLAGVAEQTLPDRDQRTSFFAGLNFWVQIGTLIMQTVLIGPIMRKLGLSVALMILPAVYLISFLVLSTNGSLFALGLVDIARRIAVYGATSPSREVLFTVVSRRAKYAAKNLMDTVLIRGSDSLTSAIFVQLEKVLAVTYFGFLMVPITVLWLFVGWSLGRQQQVKSRQ